MTPKTLVIAALTASLVATPLAAQEATRPNVPVSVAAKLRTLEGATAAAAATQLPAAMPQRRSKPVKKKFGLLGGGLFFLFSSAFSAGALLGQSYISRGAA